MFSVIRCSSLRSFQIATLCLLTLFAAAPTASAQLSVPANVKVGERLLFILANQERLQRGLNALRWDDALYSSAHYHATWMARRADISHQFPGEPDLSARASKLGAQFSVVAENIAIVNEIHSAHDEWMKSPGHRENLLDPRLDSVGIAFEIRNGRFYVVQDFSRAVTTLSFQQQEQHIAQMLRDTGLVVYDTTQATDAARRTCDLDTGWAGPTKPNFTMRWISGDLNTVPGELNRQLATGKYTTAWVGACKAKDTAGFAAYSLVVMLFMRPPQEVPQVIEETPNALNQPPATQRPQPKVADLPPQQQN